MSDIYWLGFAAGSVFSVSAAFLLGWMIGNQEFKQK